MSIHSIAVLADELARAADRVAEQDSLADALLVTDRYDRVARLRSQLDDPADMDDTRALLDGFRPLVDLCRTQVQGELAREGALAGLPDALEAVLGLAVVLERVLALLARVVVRVLVRVLREVVVINHHQELCEGARLRLGSKIFRH